MPIQQVSDTFRFRPLGVIRLGTRKKTNSGFERPVDEDHFVLTDAPEVAEVYGNDPTELDIVFPSNDLDKVIPTWYKWFGGGVRGEGGEIKGGRLKCYGNGPKADGTPGTAVYLEKRDPITRAAPTRDCLGSKCPDWKDAKGRQQCSQLMQVYCILPRVCWDGVFVISTRSWNSIGQFWDHLKFIQMANDGIIMNSAYKIRREQTSITYTDTSGNLKNSEHHIMYLRPNRKFEELYGQEVRAKLAATFSSGKFIMPSAEEALALPPPSAFVPEGDSAASAQSETDAKVAQAKAILDDPEVKEAFEVFEKVTEKVYPEKKRIQAVMKLIAEGVEDLKGAVLGKLRPGPATPVTVEVSAVVEPPTPPQEDSGVM